MKKNKLWIAGLLLSVMTLAACGGAGESTQQAAVSEAVAEPVQKEPKSDTVQEVNADATEEVQPQEAQTGNEAVAQSQENQSSELKTTPSEAEEETLGNPRSSYGLGSAPFLEGDNLLVSMFVTTPESSWSEEEKQKILAKIGVATDYIETQAAGYGVDARLIYDYEEYPVLYAEAETDFYINEETDFLDRLDEEIALWFEEKINYEELLSQFDAEGIATMVFVNNPGISYAIVYDGTDNIKESLVLFSGDYYNGGKSEKPITYAHEILHIFGAHDLYEDAEFTAEVTEYVEKTYPEEIMLTVTGSGNTQSAINAYLSPITAYHLGWLGETEEINLFPQLARE